MPGMSLQAKCNCGFLVGNLTVGATQEGHYELLFCEKCEHLKSYWITKKSKSEKNCKRCLSILKRITCYEFWIPREYHSKYDDFDPWLIEDENAQQIRYKCPSCKLYTLSICEGDFSVQWD